jgi:signal peptidase II
MTLRRLPWLLLPLAVLALDLLSKAWIRGAIPLHGNRVIIPGFFNLTLGYNPGAIFGTLANAPPAVRGAIFLVAGIAALGYFGWEFLRDSTPTPQRIGLGCIIGGALGNQIDRLQHGAVCDFLDFVFFDWHYWTFNLADSFIVCGAILLGAGFLWEYRKQRNAEQGAM